MDFFEGKEVSKIRFGLKHSGAITQDGELWMWGKGNYGVLGQGNEDDARIR